MSAMSGYAAFIQEFIDLNDLDMAFVNLERPLLKTNDNDTLRNR